MKRNPMRLHVIWVIIVYIADDEWKSFLLTSGQGLKYQEHLSELVSDYIHWNVQNYATPKIPITYRWFSIEKWPELPHLMVLMDCAHRDNSTHLSLSLRLKSRRVCLVSYSSTWSVHMFQVTGRLLWWTWCELISRSPASRQVEVPASFGWEVRLVTSPMCSLFW